MESRSTRPAEQDRHGTVFNCTIGLQTEQHRHGGVKKGCVRCVPKETANGQHGPDDQGGGVAGREERLRGGLRETWLAGNVKMNLREATQEIRLVAPVYQNLKVAIPHNGFVASRHLEPSIRGWWRFSLQMPSPVQTRFEVTR